MLNLKKIIFDYVTVIEVLVCCGVLNFIKIGSCVRPPDARNCRMFNALLIGNGRNGRCHGNRIMADMSATWWNATTQVSSNRSIDREFMAFPKFCIWRTSAILNMNFVILDHPRSELCGSITRSEFGVDPIFPAEDIAIL